MRRFFTKHGLMVLAAAAAVMVILSLVTFFSNNTNALTNVVNVIAAPFRSASAAVSGWVDDKVRFAREFDALEEENQAHSWQAGGVYTFQAPQGFTELWLEAALEGEARTLDLLPLGR